MLRAILLGTFAVWLFIGAAWADQAEPAGSTAKALDEFYKADAIFVGEIIKFGPVALKGPGKSAVCGVKVKVSLVLRGAVGSQVSLTIDINGASSSPAVKPGDSCIFIVRKIASPDPDPYLAFQMLPATDANVAFIKQQITKLPAE